MRIIEHYATGEVAEGAAPVPALIEDDDSGLRFLWVGADWDYTLKQRTWTEAHRAGAVGIVLHDPDDETAPYLGIDADTFASNRIERGADFVIPGAFDDPDLWAEAVTLMELGLAMAAPGAEPENDGEFVSLHTHSEYCLAPDTLVVTAAMEWKPISEVQEGEELVGFDEDLRPPEGERGNSRSKMRRTTVLATRRFMRDCYRITFSDGTSVVASAQHGWVTTGTHRGSLVEPNDSAPKYLSENTRKWVNTADLIPGKSKLVVWARPWESLKPHQERDAAWLAGVLDGEGWCHAGQVSIGQNPGLVWDEILRVCRELGYETTTPRLQAAGRGTCQTFRFKGYETAVRAISQCRPVRLLPRLDEIWVGRRAGGKNTLPLLVTRLEHLGECETVALTTSTKTFVAEGFLSHNSALDGFSRIPELVAAAVGDGQPALGIADHGNNAGHPELALECSKAGIKPVFGMEAYFVADRKRRTRSWIEEVPDENSKTGKMKEVKRSDFEEVKQYNHLCLWATDDASLRRLWAASTEAYMTGLYNGNARLDWEVLERYGEGLIASTGCLKGPLAERILAEDDQGARQVLGRLQGIFGDRLVIEIHTNSLLNQIIVNKASVDYAREMGIRMIAAVDSHYTEACDAEMHHTWMAMQVQKDISEETGMFGGEPTYFMHTAKQVRAALDYLPDDVVEECLANTLWVAEQATATIVGEPTPPIFSKGQPTAADRIAEDRRRLRAMCEDNWERKVIGKAAPEATYRERFERELGLLEEKDFCGYFLLVADYVRAAKREGILVGPGRGSGGGSLVAYLADIVEIDPIKYDCMFERFLTKGRMSLPDFDIDFPASKREWIKNYLAERWGADHVVTIGTTTRLQAKGAIDNAFRVLKSTLGEVPYYIDQKVVTKIIDAANAPLAGKQISWEELWDQFGEVLEPIRRKYPHVFEVADQAVGRIKTYGKHAAGVVVSTDKSLMDLPLRMGEDGMVVTQFDMHAVEALGYVKCDLLTLRTLDTVQETIDLIEARYGKRINPYDWDEQLEDPQVWDEIADGNTLGLFQVETNAGTRLVRKMKPPVSSIEDLAVIMSIVRPGPTRSGLTDAYLRRRAGEESVSYPDPRMKDFLEPTYGAMIYQEQILSTCMELAGYTDTEADEVRKILGKKQVEKVAAAGDEFLRRAVKHNTDPKVAALLWAQMAEFAKYGFGKAHAIGYSVLGFWTAFLKFHYSTQFLTAALSTVDDDRIPDFVQETRQMGFTIRPPDINASGVMFTPTPEGIRYGLTAVKGVGEDTVRQIISGQPYRNIEDFRARMLTKGSKVNAGHLRALVAIGAFDSLHPNRRGLEQLVEFYANGEDEICIHRNTAVKSSDREQVCTLDWANEPHPVMVKIRKRDCPAHTGEGCAHCDGTGFITAERKPPPKKCSRACRNYTRPDPLNHEQVTPYTKDDLIAREYELLGVHLTGSPFDRIPPEILEMCFTAKDVDRGEEGEYIVAALVESFSMTRTRNGDPYAWIDLNAQDGSLRATCWSRELERYRQDLSNVGGLIIAVLYKNDRGVNLREVYPT